MSKLHEKPVVIQGWLPTPMLGVLIGPADGTKPSGVGVVVVNGGAQYRAGAHRLFVQLARHLAQQGHTVLRFDFPGQGDSPGEPVSFEDTSAHIASAIDGLHQQVTGIHATVLIGLCDGASASLLYLQSCCDERITHLVLLNPWADSPVTHARAQVRHYYRQRLLMPDFWRKLIRGDVGWSALRDWWTQWRLSRQQTITTEPVAFQDRMAMAWHGCSGRMLLILSEHDRVAQAFEEHARTSALWDRWQQRIGLHLRHLKGADHTFSSDSAQSDVMQAVLSFLEVPSKRPW